jgi:hypothetical protein
MGKTLSLLALVCSSLDALGNQEDLACSNTSNATLVVTPKSSTSDFTQTLQGEHLTRNSSNT